MGIVLMITLAFGLITPPYGPSLLMASKFVGVRFSLALRASLPIYVIFSSRSPWRSFSPRRCFGCGRRFFRSRSAASRPRTVEDISALERASIEPIERRRIVDQNAISDRLVRRPISEEAQPDAVPPNARSIGLATDR
jgi:hypothetical protein